MSWVVSQSSTSANIVVLHTEESEVVVYEGSESARQTQYQEDANRPQCLLSPFPQWNQEQW